jgi:hypothetical protein
MLLGLSPLLPRPGRLRAKYLELTLNKFVHEVSNLGKFLLLSHHLPSTKRSSDDAFSFVILNMILVLLREKITRDNIFAVDKL